MNLMLIILLLTIGLYWSNSMKANEIAFYFVKNHCQKLDIQLLDEYVALNSFWIKRDEQKKIKIWRSYQFEFTSTGYERCNGKVILLGHKILNIQLDPYIIKE